jgi:uncharacterized protein (DUF2062 family)
VPRRFFRKHLPHPDAVRGYRWLAPFARWLQHPNLWHLNRRSVSRAFGIGLFAGLVPGPLQMLAAALLAVPLRANLLVALATTLYTNPLTIVPLYLLAYEYGQFLLGHAGGRAPIRPFEMDWSNLVASTHAMFDWCVAMGKPLALGLLALALTLGTAGAVAARLAWRAYVIVKWNRRRAARP